MREAIGAALTFVGNCLLTGVCLAVLVALLYGVGWLAGDNPGPPDCDPALAMTHGQYCADE